MKMNFELFHIKIELQFKKYPIVDLKYKNCIGRIVAFHAF